MTLTVQVQKHTGLANTHIGVGSPGICKRFFPHWVETLAPEDIDSLTYCRAVRHAPVLRPRSILDGHLRRLQRHRGCMRAILLLHNSCNILAHYEPKEPIVDMRLHHTCHVKRRWMPPSTTPTTQSAAASRVTKRPKGAIQCHKCHACHAKWPWMWDCVTPATWNKGGRHQVPRLPRKVPRRYARLNQAQAHHPMSKVPRLPRKTAVDVKLRHICPVKQRWMSPSVTPATQSTAASRATKPGPSAPPNAISATPATQNKHDCQIVPRLPREMKVEVVYVWVCVKLLYVKFVCVKWFCMLNLCVWRLWYVKFVCVKL